MKKSQLLVMGTLVLSFAMVGCSSKFQTDVKKAGRSVKNGESVIATNAATAMAPQCVSSILIEPSDLQKTENFESYRITGFFEVLETPQILDMTLSGTTVSSQTSVVYNGQNTTNVHIQGQCLTESCTEYVLVIESMNSDATCVNDDVQLGVFKSEVQGDYIYTFTGKSLSFEQIKAEVVLK